MKFGDKLLVRQHAVCFIHMMSSSAQSPSVMEDSRLSASTLSPNTTGVGVDEDTIGSITNDFSESFAHKFTPMTWSKSLNTPTPNQSYVINSNMSSITYMKHAHFNNENDTPLVDINQTPMRDLNPEYQDVPHVKCPMSGDSQISSASLESPPVVKVLSPASQFRLKRAVFESRAKAVKSPNRKQRAQNVTVLDNSPSMAPQDVECDISPSCAIESELGDETDEVPVATAHAMPLSMKVMDSIVQETEIDEKEEYEELQYEEPLEKENHQEMMPAMKDVVEHFQKEPRKYVESEVLSVTLSEEECDTPAPGLGLSKSMMYLIGALLFVIVCFGSAFLSSTGSGMLPPTSVSLDTPSLSLPVPADTVYVNAMPEAEVTPEAEEYDYVPIEDAELSLSVTYKSVFRLDARELPFTLYMQLRQLCITHYAQLHAKLVEYDAQHGHRLQIAAEKLRGQAEVYLAVLGDSVVQFHHHMDALGIRDEWLKLKHELAIRVVQSGVLDEYARLKDEIMIRVEQAGLPEKWQQLKHEVSTRVEASGIKDVLAQLQREYKHHAPIVKERVQEELQRAQRHTLTNLLNLHRFIKENELLADEFY